MQDYIGDDLTGKFLSEIPMHQAHLGLLWRNPVIDISVAGNYIGEIWADAENTQIIDSYYIFDAKLSKKIKDKLFIGFTVQNILDDPFIDKKGRLSPGRFMTFELTYYFSATGNEVKMKKQPKNRLKKKKDDDE